MKVKRKRSRCRSKALESTLRRSRNDFLKKCHATRIEVRIGNKMPGQRRQVSPVSSKEESMLEELDKIPLDQPYIFINLFNVAADATEDDLRDVFSKFEIEEFLQNQTMSNLWDLKMRDRETFKMIVEKPKYWVLDKPAFMRFSLIIRQSKPPETSTTRPKTPARRPSSRGAKNPFF